MADVFMYVDETGNLDFDGAAKGSAASIYSDSVPRSSEKITDTIFGMD